MNTGEIAVPVIQHFFCQIDCADQFGEVLAGKGKLASVHLAEQILAGNRHVFRISGANIIVTLVGAGTALNAGIEKHGQ